MRLDQISTKSKLIGSVYAAAVFCTSVAQANVGEAYGFGSRTASLGGVGSMGTSEGFNAYYNPAALSLQKSKRTQLNLATVYMQPKFLPITNVVVQNKFNSDGTKSGDVHNEYEATFGQTIGLSHQLLPNTLNWSFGLVGYLPIDQIAYMDTGEGLAPEYILYRARTQRPQFELGTGVDLGRGFHFGVGLHIAYSLTSNTTLFMNTDKSGASSMRFSARMKPKAAPFFGVLFASPDHPEDFSVGGTFRLPVSSANVMKLHSSVSILPPFGAPDLAFTAASTLFYDPMAIEFGTGWKYSSFGKVFGQVDYQMWSLFESPALLIEDPNGQIRPGKAPELEYVNILVPRFGNEFYLSKKATARIGYAYRPSILKELPTGVGNFLDPPKHMLSLGFGFEFNQFLGLGAPCRVDLHASWHSLVKQTISKTSGNEAGIEGDSKIGSPGYEAGGNILGGGASLSFVF